MASTKTLSELRKMSVPQLRAYAAKLGEQRAELHQNAQKVARVMAEHREKDPDLWLDEIAEVEGRNVQELREGAAETQSLGT